MPISCIGSSGVKPFIENLSQDYMKSNKNVDITIDAGGSGFGIEQIANGFANIGNASKDPYNVVQKESNGFRDK
jgi:phosphate transport system substrate-binding protein